MEVLPELLQAFAGLLANAMQASAMSGATAGGSEGANGVAAGAPPKPPPFSMTAYRSTDGTTVEDYFKSRSAGAACELCPCLHGRGAEQCGQSFGESAFA